MQSLSDLHIHSTCSGDGRSTVAAVCRRAVELGLERIAFTEHVDFEPTDPHYAFYDYLRHRAEVEAAREDFGDRLDVLLGVEVDYQPGYHDRVAQFLAVHDFDLVLGAVHYIGHQMLESAAFLAQPQRDAYGRYFQAVTQAAQTGLFQVMAHVDYCKRAGHTAYGAYDPVQFQDEVRAMLRALVETGTVLEINTSGLRHDPQEAYPSPVIVQWYGEMGGQRVCLGSDAHDETQLASGLEEGVRIAQQAGFTRWEGGWLLVR